MSEAKVTRRRVVHTRLECLYCGTRTGSLRGTVPVCHGCCIVLDMRLWMTVHAEGEGIEIAFPPLARAPREEPTES